MEGLFRRKERQKDAMLSVVSHEFKTPLNGLLVSAQLLSRLPEVRCLSKDAREMIDSVSQCGTLLSLLVQNVLLRERLPKLELSLIPLAPLLADVSQILSNLGTVRTLVECRDAVVFGNHSALLQILLNLGSNAIKFSQLPIVVRVTRDGEMVGIAVEDGNFLFLA